MDTNGHQDSKYRITYITWNEFTYFAIVLNDGSKTTLTHVEQIPTNSVSTNNECFHSFQLKYAQRHLILPHNQYEITPKTLPNIESLSKQDISEAISLEQNIDLEKNAIDFTPIADQKEKIFAFKTSNHNLNTQTNIFKSYATSFDSITVMDTAINGLNEIIYLDKNPTITIFIGEEFSRAYVHSSNGIHQIIPIPALIPGQLESVMNIITKTISPKLTTTSEPITQCYLFTSIDDQRNTIITHLKKNLDLTVQDISHHPKLLKQKNEPMNIIEAFASLSALNLANMTTPNRYINLITHKKVMKDWRYYLNKATLERLGLGLVISGLSTGIVYAHEHNRIKRSNQLLAEKTLAEKTSNTNITDYKSTYNIIAVGHKNISLTNINPTAYFQGIQMAFAKFNRNSIQPSVWVDKIQLIPEQHELTITGYQTNALIASSLKTTINKMIVDNTEINHRNIIHKLEQLTTPKLNSENTAAKLKSKRISKHEPALFTLSTET